MSASRVSNGSSLLTMSERGLRPFLPSKGHQRRGVEKLSGILAEARSWSWPGFAATLAPSSAAPGLGPSLRSRVGWKNHRFLLAHRFLFPYGGDACESSLMLH